MEAIATQKFLRMSPRKLRLAVELIKHLKPQKAIDVLPFTQKRAAEPLAKVIKTAIANARVKGMDDSNLVFAEIQIGQGPQLKRWRAGSRGRAKPFTRDMSHIRVIVKEGPKVQEVKKTEKKVVEAKEIKVDKPKVAKKITTGKETK